VLERADELVPAFPAATQAFVVTDRTVHDAWFPPLAAAFDRVRLHAVPLIVPAGEEAKSLDVYRALLHHLATQGAHRDEPIVALGGGATGDRPGSVAGSDMRWSGSMRAPAGRAARRSRRGWGAPRGWAKPPASVRTGGPPGRCGCGRPAGWSPTARCRRRGRSSMPSSWARSPGTGFAS